MSISSTTAYIGPTLGTSYPLTIPVFPFQASSDLLVLNLGQTGSVNDPATILVLGSDYTVTGGGYNANNQMQTGSVIVVTSGTNPPNVNDLIVVLRNVPLNQTQDFLATGPLTISLLEQALDKTATIDQQLNELIATCLKFENFETLGTTLLLSQRAGYLLGFGTDGNIAYYPSTNGGTFASPTLTGTVTLPSGGTLTSSGTTDVFSDKQRIKGGIVGVADASNATAGNIGEYLTLEKANNTTAISNATTINVAGVGVAMVTLTAGDWDVGGTLYCLTASATMTQLVGCISSITASVANTIGVSALPLAFTTTTFNIKLPLPTQRFNVSTSTPIYLNGEAFFSAGSATVGGTVWARRCANAK